MPGLQIMLGTEIIKLERRGIVRRCAWEVAIRNPVPGDSQYFEVIPVRTPAGGREVALAILDLYPWLITSVRQRT